MPELAMSVLVSRPRLGLSALQINDHENFYISNSDFMSGQVAWNRVTATSPFMDGGVTLFRSRQVVSHNITVEVMGEDLLDLRLNIDLLAKAFMQDYFTLTVDMGGNAKFIYRAEAADYAVRHDGPRWIAHQVQMQFVVPVQPMPIAGVV